MERKAPPWYYRRGTRLGTISQSLAAGAVGATLGLGAALIAGLPPIWIPFVLFALALPFIVLFIIKLAD